MSRVTKAPTLFATIPIAFPDSGTAALLMAINASWFTDVAQEVAQSALGGLALIVDGEGTILSRSGDGSDQNLGPILSQLRTFDRDAAQPLVTSDGTRLVVAVRDIPSSQAMLVVGVPEARLNRHALLIETNLFADLAIAIGVILLIFWLGHENFVRPLLTLAQAARRIGNGKFDVAIATDRWASEFQTLAAAITTASANLAARAEAEATIRASLRAQSQEDPLTGLKNRRGLDHFVEFEWRFCQSKNASFAVIAFDIDYFKPFNDCYGHAAGDDALRAVSRIMQAQAVNAGGLAARTGGEEFTIVIPDISIAQAATIADAVSLRITALRIPHAGSPLGMLTVSAGIASIVADSALDPSDVFRAADRALYGAKDAGRNRITVGEVVSAARSVLQEPGSDGTRAGSCTDTENRMLPAFPSARSQ